MIPYKLAWQKNISYDTVTKSERHLACFTKLVITDWHPALS
jgi:hypothetical protein